MKDKITYLMKNEGLTTTRLAEILEIQPSAVSHLVSGRNKPGYDLLQKILRRFPRLNPDWLLLDSGQPYRAESEDSTNENTQSSVNATLPFDSPSSTQKPVANTPPINFPIDISKSSPTPGSKSPIFVVVFYDDGSCENYSMRG